MKVYLSPSDQWSNTVADGEHSEAYHCTQIANKTKTYLEENGYTVKVGDNSKEKTYSKRVTDSNNWDADLHVCIHTNAGGGQGTLMLAYPTSVSNKYVKSIYTEVANLTPTTDRGIQSRTDLYEIKKTKCVCAYIEVDFHDNGVVEEWIDNNIDNIAKAICNGICKADNKIMKDNTTKANTSSNTASTTLYRVQCGAFSDKANAEKLETKLKESGFDCYIVG